MRRPLVLAAIALVAALALTSCQPDPTTARPPPAGASVPAFRSSIATVTSASLPYSWRSGCPVGPSLLRLVTLDHWGFDGRVRSGRLVVHRDVATDVVAAFHRLYDARFQIQRMELVDVYQGSDAASMDANNTSAFNCRAVTGGSSWSEHSYGWAIDINPVQNPYVSGSTVLPAAGRQWLDRTDVVPAMIVRPGPVVDAFAAIGWRWGGDWTTKKDYQHVSLTGR